MIVLSLFDGMACGYEALKTAGIFVEKYYASEIDPYAIKIAKKNHPDIVHLGDVTRWQEWDIQKPDLIIGGSPCQGFSFAGKGLAFDDPRSKLFFEMTDIIRHYDPQFKLLENVKMKKEFLDIITDFMDCGEPHFINSALVSAQNRQRYYWYNWEAPDPVDRGIILADIIEDGEVDRDKSYCIDANYYKGGSLKNYLEKSRRQVVLAQSEKRLMVKGSRIVGRRLGDDGKRDDYNMDIKEMEKSPTLTAQCFEQNFSISKKSNCITAGMDRENVKSMLKREKYGPMVPKITEDNVSWRKLTPVECERLQTLPDGYTAGVSNTQRYRMLGNGWTKDVIAHLFSHIPISDIERMMQ